VVHRGDLQAALSAAVTRQLDITVRLGLRVQDFVTHAQGLTVSARGAAGEAEVRGVALLAADGLWSTLRQRIGHRGPPRFAGRTAWRGLIPAKEVAPEFREPVVHLWLGRDAHFVHYPVKAGRVINAVLITADRWQAPGWSEPARRTDLIARLPATAWAPPVRALAAAPEAWLKWALYDRAPIRRWYSGPVALLGDAAHPMLPFVAQGAAMAIEDAAVAAQCLAQRPDNVAAALRTYCAVRRPRTRRIARLAAHNGFVYELGGTGGWVRDAVMRALGGPRLLHRYDWVYDWQPPIA
jgi:salicylate hydroxylase